MIFWDRKTVLGVALSVAFLLSSAGAAGKKTVVTSFTILADMARNVAGDRLIVESITKPGAEIHGYQPTPSDIVRAQKADLVLYNGLNLERWFERFLRQIKGVPSVILTTGIVPMNIAADAYAGKPNPHAWMSPKNGLVYVENIRLALTRIDPDGAATFARNARTYSDKLRLIDTQLNKTLALLPASRRALVSCEGAFSYLARDYGLKEVYMWPVNADEQGTPRQVQRVIDTVRRDRVPGVFCESTVQPDGMQQVAREAGSSYGGVLYVDSLSAASGPVPTYLKLLQYDADTILKGLKVERK